MKKTILMLMVAGLFAAMPVVAADELKPMPLGATESDTAGEHVQRCVLQSEAIGQKIQRLQSEIKKGDKKYSAEELRKLEEKLTEANFMLDSITKP
jgi:Skp family chaperone for outer membrane proteins